MPADALSLLFQIDADGRPAVEEFKRVRSAFASELAGLKKLAESAVKLNLVDSRPASGTSEGAAASKTTLDSQREVNRQLEAMWAERERQQTASLKKQSDTERAFGAQQVSTALTVEKQIADAYKDRESQLAKTAKQSEDAWAKHEAAKLAITRQAEKEGEAAVAASSAAKEKAAKIASDNFLKQQKQTAGVVAAANAQTAANEIRAALVAAKGTADVSSVASRTIKDLGDQVNVFVGQRIPLFGGAFIRVTDNLRNFNVQAGNVEASTLRLGKAINALAAGSGKTASEIKGFLSNFKELGTQAEKDAAAVEFFGAAIAQKLLPQLGTAEAEIAGLTSVTEEAATGLGGIIAAAGPVGVAIAGIAIEAGILVVGMKLLADVGIDVGQRFLDLAKKAAGFRGEMLDLSQQLGISTETLSAFEVFAKTTGGDIGSISASLGIFQRNLEAAHDPTSKEASLLKELGVTSLETEDAIRQTIAGLFKLGDSAKQTDATLTLFGRGGRFVNAILKETKGDLDGAIARLQKLGLIVSREDAEAADKFNDALTFLELRFRALLGNDVIPAATDAVEKFSKFVDDNRKEIGFLNDILRVSATVVSETFKNFIKTFEVFKPFIEEEIEKWNRLEDAIRSVLNLPADIPALKVPDSFKGLTPVPLPSPVSDLTKAKEEARLVRAEIDEAVRFANEQVDAIDRQLKAREIAPAQALEGVIATEKEKTRLVVEGLRKQQEARAKETAIDEAAKQKQFEDVQEFNTKIQTAEDAFRKLEADKRAEFRAQELEREQAHRRARASIFEQTLANQISSINKSAEAGRTLAVVAADTTVGLLEAIFAKRREILEKERAEAGQDVALVQRINDQLAELQRQRTEALQQQSERRIELVRQERERTAEIEQRDIDALLRVIEITNQRRITSLQALASARVITEESAAKQILAIQLEANRQEIELALTRRDAITEINNQILADLVTQRNAAEKKLQEAGGITDPTARIAAQADAQKEIARIDALRVEASAKANKDEKEATQKFNNDIKILKAERITIEADGNRDIDAKRQEDLENARKYEADLKLIQQEIVDIQRDTAEEVIRLMILQFANPKDIIRKQRDLDLAVEAARHKRVADSIKAQQSEVDEEIRIREQRLKDLKIGTTEEIEQHDRLIEELEKLRLKREELDAQQDAEDKRTKTKTKVITTQATSDEVKTEAVFVPEEDLARISQSLERVGSITAGINAAFRELKAIGLDAFKSLADGIGEIVQNYVLLGSTGPAALRKLLAATLAQIAAESAVRAIYWTAQGIADLFFNPARAAADFTAAALFASIAGVSALVGRHVAGNLFQKDTASRAVTGGEPQPNNQTFNSAGQGPVETSSQAAREGSAIADALNRHTAATLQLNATISRWETRPEGVVFANGAQQRPDAVGVAFMRNSQSNFELNDHLRRIASGTE